MPAPKPKPDPRWESADFRLPRSENLPAEVVLADGTKERRDKLEGSWSQVRQWRTGGKKEK